LIPRRRYLLKSKKKSINYLAYFFFHRCLIKHLEGLTINYDATVRDSDGCLIQFYYGEDGLDIPKSRFLTEEQFGFLVDNKNAVADADLMKHLKASVDTQTFSKQLKRIRKWTKKNGDPLANRRLSEFSKFSIDNKNPNSTKNTVIDPQCGRSKASLSLMKKWIRASEETRQSYRNQCTKCPEPLIAKYRQDMTFGILSEKLEQVLDKYISKASFTTSLGKEELRDVLCAKVMNTFCPPGEPVGLLGNYN
jgi:DNA-directed RNA polymerase I subunit RPA1